MTSIFGSGAGLAFGDESQGNPELGIISKSSLMRRRSVLLPER